MTVAIHVDGTTTKDLEQYALSEDEGYDTAKKMKVFCTAHYSKTTATVSILFSLCLVLYNMGFPRVECSDFHSKHCSVFFFGQDPTGLFGSLMISAMVCLFPILIYLMCCVPNLNYGCSPCSRWSSVVFAWASACRGIRWICLPRRCFRFFYCVLIFPVLIVIKRQ